MGPNPFISKALLASFREVVFGDLADDSIAVHCHGPEKIKKHINSLSNVHGEIITIDIYESMKIHANNDQMEVSYNGGYLLNPFW